jgi:sulfur-carrier protein
MNTIDVKYFAFLREKAGVESESLTFEGTHKELYDLLSDKYKFDLPHAMIQVAVNDEFTSMNSLVLQNSKIVFIPPVAGG